MTSYQYNIGKLSYRVWIGSFYYDKCSVPTLHCRLKLLLNSVHHVRMQIRYNSIISLLSYTVHVILRHQNLFFFNDLAVIIIKRRRFKSGFDPRLKIWGRSKSNSIETIVQLKKIDFPFFSTINYALLCMYISNSKNWASL